MQVKYTKIQAPEKMYKNIGASKNLGAYKNIGALQNIGAYRNIHAWKKPGVSQCWCSRKSRRKR
jgi:hypothetical protein